LLTYRSLARACAKANGRIYLRFEVLISINVLIRFRLNLPVSSGIAVLLVLSGFTGIFRND
jgi:hypothetical protein